MFSRNRASGPESKMTHMFRSVRQAGQQSDARQRCLVEFARVAAPRRSLPYPTASCYNSYLLTCLLTITCSNDLITSPTAGVRNIAIRFSV